MLKFDPLAFLRNPKEKKIVLRVPSETGHIRKVSSRILGSLAPYALDEGRIFDIRLCIEEAVRNAMVHGNHSDRKLDVTVSYLLEGDKLTIEVEDKGMGFDHATVDDPTLEPHMLKNSGRGVYLIKKLMDKTEYNSTGNKLTMVKNLK